MISSMKSIPIHGCDASFIVDVVSVAVFMLARFLGRLRVCGKERSAGGYDKVRETT